MKTTIYLATADGLSALTGSVGNWRGAVHLRGKEIQCVAAGAKNGIVYCGTFGAGVFRSEDQGATWKVCSGVGEANVTALGVSNSGTVYVGTEPSALFRSDDSGKSWQELQTMLTLPSATEWSFPPRPETHHVRSILPSLAKARRVHVAVEAGALLLSDDAGVTWRDRVSSGPKDIHSLAVHPRAPKRLHSAAGDGYFESVDDGDTWRRMVDGLEHQYCWSVAVSSADPNTLLISASKNAYRAHYEEAASSFVYRRSGDEAWRQAMDGLPERQSIRIPVVAASNLEPGIFYCCVEGELYRSADDGLGWEKVAVSWDGQTTAEHAIDMAIVEEAE